MSGSLLPQAGDATLVLVRHGETDAILERRFQGRADTALSARGRRQAELVAARLAGRALRPPLPLPPSPPRRIVCSPLSRAADTAATIASAMRAADHPVPLNAVPALAEIGQGAWEGMRLEDIETAYADALGAWRRAPWEAHAPGGEPLAVADARVREWLGPALADLVASPCRRGRSGSTAGPRLRGRRSGRPVGDRRRARRHLQGAPDRAPGPPPTAFWRFPFAPAAITVVEVRDGSARLRLHNAVEHLAPLLDEDPTRLRPSDAL